MMSFHSPGLSDNSNTVSASVLRPIGDDNIGSRLLSSMGWTSGTALGSSGNGLLAPLAPTVYARNAGIGAASTGVS